VDGNLNRGALLRPDGLRIMGRKVHALPFSNHHLRDPAYLSWLHDSDVVRAIGRPDYVAAPVPFEVVQDYCTSLMNSDCDLFLALYHTADGCFIGTLKAGHIDWNSGTADIGIMIGVKDLWGGGFATDAIGALALHLFDRLGLRRLTAGVMGINPAMIKVFEKLGFHREGVLRDHLRYDGGVCDHVLLGCFRAELRIV
jgi:[ribosomal protein S5]-alanine N-acetyltransferase